ncbi:hypothetical protein Q19_04 [Pectobacterium phage Q19]|uniref:Uncharacterized protein n=1 Tax=Pectobacterium phage Q19 TaxID=2500576 RepID=A0A678ZZL4_9CAUD|nr:hypothetical protein Q19_04 [Pectobacterium phage Q19]
MLAPYGATVRTMKRRCVALGLPSRAAKALAKHHHNLVTKAQADWMY